MQAFKVGLVAVILGAIGAVLVVITPSWFPVAASVQAGRVDDIYMALMIMSSFIFMLVVTFLGYSMWKFRAKPGDMSDGPPIEGNTSLEIVWTIIPLILVLGFATWGAIAVSKNEQTSNDMLVVNVTGREFIWDFAYPAQRIQPAIPEVPVGQKVLFKINGVRNDVIHEFYIPAFRLGIDAVPGTPTSLIVDPDRIGQYNIICNMLCGIGHSQMRTVINVVSQGRLRQVGGPPAVSAQAPAQAQDADHHRRRGRRQGALHHELRWMPHAGGSRFDRHHRARPGSHHLRRHQVRAGPDGRAVRPRLDRRSGQGARVGVPCASDARHLRHAAFER